MADMVSRVRRGLRQRLRHAIWASMDTGDLSPGISEVRQGKKIASSLNQYSLMPTNVVQMIRSGEDSGTMADVLRDVSNFYARELKTVIKAVTSMIEPIMIVLMGVLVGFIAMSIILPIFRMSSVVMGK